MTYTLHNHSLLQLSDAAISYLYNQGMGFNVKRRKNVKILPDFAVAACLERFLAEQLAVRKQSQERLDSLLHLAVYLECGHANSGIDEIENKYDRTGIVKLLLEQFGNHSQWRYSI